MNLKLTIIFFLFFACSKNPNETGFEILPDMVHSVAYEAYSENPITKDGKTMILPAKGSIARGKMPFNYGVGVQEAIRAGRELNNPFVPNEVTLARGKKIYDNYCLVCHGVKGKGDGPLIPKFPNPPALTSKRLLKYPAGRIFHIVTKGSGDMPAHGAQISVTDRWYLVHYVLLMQKLYKKK